MSESRWHISSAVVSALPEALADVAELISQMEGVEIHAQDDSRIIVTIEGQSTGILGDSLTSINLLPGVLAANMVFEHAEDAEELQ
ncbi:chaperone NapD [Falsihalocynthiibacter sp. SS001]|uniref:chaperone NapD n=1 Tax=Falsihalocynthiibacter sp. SS001 TaxID=3349698 RepID=UPI0036D3800F